ncbi:C-C motif chemokine 28 [Arapaima gigas]
MDLRLAVVLLLLCAIFSISEGGIPQCCVTTKVTHKKILRMAKKLVYQHPDGFCDIEAFIIYTHNKRYCIPPSMKKHFPSRLVKNGKF